MFEKEAEEYTIENVCSACYFEKPCENKCEAFGCADSKTYVLKAFKDGAEFGYNKANEWHYVKDGDLPKAYQKCYFIYSNNYGEDNKVIFSKYNINVLTGVYAFVIDEESDEETTEPCFYDDINDDEIDLSEVYAWKEIVLPELPKESE